MSTVKSKNLQVGTDATASNNFTIYQPSTPDGTLRIGVGNADSPTEVAQVTSSGITMASGKTITGNVAGSGSNLTDVPATSTALAFYARNSVDQSVSSSTTTKVVLDTEEFDTGGCFDTSNSRFTPTVAGYYFVNGFIRYEAASGSTNRILYIYKNTSNYLISGNKFSGTGVDYATGSWLVYMNGTTDYLEMYGYISGTSTILGYSNPRNCCWFQGYLVQKA